MLRYAKHIISNSHFEYHAPFVTYIPLTLYLQKGSNVEHRHLRYCRETHISPKKLSSETTLLNAPSKNSMLQIDNKHTNHTRFISEGVGA
jgi:hypothetical protein